MPGARGGRDGTGMDVITTRDLTKVYGGTTVVGSLNLAVPHGCVYGFLGPNGSGKSTTMKMILRLVRPTSGEITVFGKPMDDANRRDLLARIGSLIEAPSVYGHLTGAENMAIAGRLLGLPEAALSRALDIVRLTGHENKLVRKYSLGMKQRLGIALALARSPQLLVLDEPTNGLDPAGTEEIRELLVSLAGEGITVMVSSHLLAEIDKMADVIGILDHGRLIFQGGRAELFEASQPGLLIDTPDVREAARLLGGDICGQVSSEHGNVIATGSDGAGTVRLNGCSPQETAQAVACLVRHDVPVYGVRRETRELEDVFLALTGRGGQL